MNVLVTGATGFLGSHLCRRLVNEGYNVTILHRPTSNVEVLGNLPVKKIIGDVTDAASVNKAVVGNEIVFHAAAHLSHWGFHKNEQNKVNVEGTKNVVEACRQFNVTRLIQVSSVGTIGISENPDQPAKEDFKFNLENSPLNYHISKKRAEEIVLKAAESGLDAVIVNPSSFWGPFRNDFRGAAFALMAKQMAIVPYLTGGMCVAHVEDVVDGIIAAKDKGKTGQRYILGGNNLSYQTIMRMGAEKLNLHRWFVPIPNLVLGLAAMTLEPLSRFTKRQPKITYAVHYCADRYSYYDSGKAQNELGYSPRNYKDILNECVDFVRAQNGEKPESSK